ncbi:MAG: hypothetical protein GY724_02125, partial [Actinomycetia bacterium]|nr:hypothetical protein [Actinomycetes bacterium]
MTSDSQTPAPIHSHVESVYVDAPPAEVWKLVTAMERYGERSSEYAAPAPPPPHPH